MDDPLLRVRSAQDSPLRPVQAMRQRDPQQARLGSLDGRPTPGQAAQEPAAATTRPGSRPHGPSQDGLHAQPPGRHAGQVTPARAKPIPRRPLPARRHTDPARADARAAPRPGPCICTATGTRTKGGSCTLSLHGRRALPVHGGSGVHGPAMSGNGRRESVRAAGESRGLRPRKPSGPRDRGWSGAPRVERVRRS